VKAEYREGEGFQQLFQSGYEVALADFLDRTHDLKLSDFVDGVDRVDAFLFV
jgi:hypothetical protein